MAVKFKFDGRAGWELTCQNNPNIAASCRVLNSKRNKQKRLEFVLLILGRIYLVLILIFGLLMHQSP
ncbi:MAG: hypothetical protein KJ600_04195 [Nanoarchaeota archaeon]|nr:hypothetical protein [Nanoarchaeota archaeon]MBU1103728.1 hypothetical protein [Nanoarchaeota archaeon]